MTTINVAPVGKSIGYERKIDPESHPDMKSIREINRIRTQMDKDTDDLIAKIDAAPKESG